MKAARTLLVALCVAAVAGCGSGRQSRGPALVPGSVMYDTEGRVINAHGGGLLYRDGRYWWYGECKGDSTYLLEHVKTWECWRADAGGVSCYSSDNLVDWRYEGLALKTSDDPSSELHPSQVIERPKVIYNDRTGKYVMWMHIESPDYEKAHCGVAVSDSPAGPFTYLGSFSPNGEDSRDQTVFKDDDGRAYQIYSSEWNRTMYIGLLSDDYLSHSGVFTRNFVGESREAPAVFKHEGKYYLITSGCSGWDPNQAQCAVADSMLGKWTVIGNPCRGRGAEDTFLSQSTYVQPLGEGRYMAMFDRWNKTDLDDSRYVWLPLSFENGSPVIEWKDSWRPGVTPENAGPGFSRPTFVYNNWSAYDELSDTIPQTAELSMKMLDRLVEMKKAGVKVDCYMMDAFWFDRDGGYRVWNRKNWPDGPDAWIKGCLDNGITPGLWFSTNLICSGGEPLVRPVREWEGSLTSDPSTVSLFEGGYLDYLMETLQMYADRGVGVFKFDFAYFDAATDSAKATMSTGEIVEANKTAFMKALRAFRRRNPSVKFIAYNGFGGIMENTTAPFGRYVDLRWLDVFDTLYSGDPRFSDVPMANIWRSEDLYSDHQVRQYIASGVPPQRVDDCSLMIGTTGTCYWRGLAAWKSSAVLNLARPGWMKVCHGNVDLLSNDDVRWLAKAQSLYAELQADGRTELVGGIPGKAEPYGYRSRTGRGTVYTLVNPSQEFARIPLDGKDGKVLFCDAGKSPELEEGCVTLGPEALAVIGFGAYASERYAMGLEEDVRIPEMIEEVSFASSLPDAHTEVCRFDARKGTYRVLMSQSDAGGTAYRTWEGGRTMDRVFSLEVTLDGKSVPVSIGYDRVIWSGMSWASGEFTLDDPGEAVVSCRAAEVESGRYSVRIYRSE